MNKSQYLKLCKNTFNEEQYFPIEKELDKFENKLIKYFGNDLELKQLKFTKIYIEQNQELNVDCELPYKQIQKFPNKYSINIVNYFNEEIYLSIIFNKKITHQMYNFHHHDQIPLFSAYCGYNQKWNNRFDLIFDKLDQIKQNKLLESITKFHMKYGLKSKNLPEAIKPILLLS